MKTLATLVLIMLAGCSTVVPVKQTWPDAPPALMEPCPPLKTLGSEQRSLRELLMIVIENYAVYYQCSNRTQSWQDWYQQQRKIFEAANK